MIVSDGFNAQTVLSRLWWPKLPAPNPSQTNEDEEAKFSADEILFKHKISKSEKTWNLHWEVRQVRTAIKHTKSWALSLFLSIANGKLSVNLAVLERLIDWCLYLRKGSTYHAVKFSGQIFCWFALTNFAYSARSRLIGQSVCLARVRTEWKWMPCQAKLNKYFPQV